ncbi:cation transporter [Roseibium salinum]|nr:cation transporter [Roseibium salinum]
MKLATSVDIPNERKPDYRKAKWLQWITIVYLISVVFVLYLVMGSSQAMRAAWLEDLLSLVPSIAWTITTPIAWRKPDPKFPYGYHRSVSIGYLAASLPLLLLGLFLVGDAAMKLVQAEHPTMGTLVIFGQPVWIGWPALLALIYSSVPSVILGRMKLKLADRLHDKVLYADAKMRKADWMTAGAAMIGIIGVGFGIWWLDAAAALVIGLDVIRDGFTQTKHAIGDLTDRRPMTTTQEKGRGPAGAGAQSALPVGLGKGCTGPAPRSRAHPLRSGFRCADGGPGCRGDNKQGGGRYHPDGLASGRICTHAGHQFRRLQRQRGNWR